MKSKEFFPGLFSRHAVAYQARLDEIMARGEAPGRMRAIELAGVSRGMRVLDLACGPGTLSRPVSLLVGPDGEVVGVDLASGMIELARGAGISNARFEVMDIEQLEFADASFDASVCGHALQFVPDLGRVLREIRRVLKAGGRLAASVPATPANETVWKLLDSVIDRHLPPARLPLDRNPTQAAVQDPPAFRQAALDAGFGSAEVEIVEEVVNWESAEHLVSLFASWWDCASRLEGIDSAARQRFMEDALTTLGREHPGPISTTSRNHVLIARV